MAQGASILIVEDDENLRLALEDNLDDEGYAVTATGTGQGALRELTRRNYDVVILDIMLPDIDGYRVCKEIRERGYPTRVLMLTARTLESDLVQGFDVGADDYLAKPYRIRELLARLGALLRREVKAEGPSAVAPGTYRFSGFNLDIEARALTSLDGEVSLTRTEFDLLACFLRNAGKAMSREDLLAAAWDPEVVVEPRTVDNFVSSLKKKMKWDRSASFVIRTVRGVGYRFECDDLE
ncbi:MAG: response regulator transcription factor, partial [Myxococcota bacterium]